MQKERRKERRIVRMGGEVSKKEKKNGTIQTKQALFIVYFSRPTELHHTHTHTHLEEVGDLFSVGKRHAGSLTCTLLRHRPWWPPLAPRQGVTHMHNEQVDPLPQQHTPPPHTQTTTPPSLTCKLCHFLHPLPPPRLPCESVPDGGCGSRAGSEGVPPAERRGGVSGQSIESLQGD